MAAEHEGTWHRLRKDCDVQVENGLVRRNDLGVSLYFLPDGQSQHGPLLHGKTMICEVLNRGFFDGLGGLDLQEDPEGFEQLPPVANFTAHWLIRPSNDMELTLDAFKTLLATQDLWSPCGTSAAGEPADMAQYFSRPRGQLSFPLEVHRLFICLFDLIEALDNADDYLKCFLLMDKLYYQPLSSLSQLSHRELLLAQYVCSTYEKAELPEEIASNFDEMWILILRNKFDVLLDAVQIRQRAPAQVQIENHS